MYKKGKFSWPSEATYEGDFKSGRMAGLGTFIGSDGDTYRGSWSSDQKHGRPDSSCYVGSWNKDIKIQQISK